MIVPLPWPCQLDVVKGLSWLWEVSSRSPVGDEQQICSSGEEDTAKLEIMVRCRNLIALTSTLHEGKYTYSHILEIILGLGPHEKLCFVQDICAENCTPRSTWICKTEDHCKHKACLLFFFFPSLLFKDDKPNPPKAVKQ